MKKILTLLFGLFAFLVNSQTTLIYTQDFSSTAPTGWAVVNAGTGNNWVLNSAPGTTYCFNGTNCMQYSYISTAAANTWAFTQGVAMTAGRTYRVEFYQRTYSSLYTEKMKVCVGNAQTVASQTTTLLTLGSLTNTTYTNRVSAEFAPATSGTYYFSFNCYSAANQWNLYVDNVRIYETIPVVPTCATLTAPTNGATGVSLTQTLSWAATSGATGYDVYFGTSATPPLVSTNQAGTTYNPGTLTGGTTYYWKINPRNSAGIASGCSTWSFTTLSPPSNDACSGATSISCGTTNLAGTTVNTVSETAPLGYSSPFGVWYSFIGGGQSTTISSTAVFDHEMTIMTGTSCGSFAIVSSQDAAIANGTETYTFTTTNGQQYYIYIAHYSTTGTSANTGTFTISRTCTAAPTPPVNDLCSSATSLPCGTSGLAGTTVNSALETAPGGGGLASPYGVWYSFVGDGQTTTISTTGTSSFDQEMTIVSGSCASNTLISSQDGAGSNGTETYTFATTNGVTYYVYVAYWSSTGLSTDVGTFTISRSCVPQPSNNNCASATSLTLQCPSSTTMTSGTTIGATEDAIAKPTCDNIGTIQDVWYSFNTGNNTAVNITVTLGTATWIGGQIFSACGTVATGLNTSCDYNLLSPSPTSITGLTTNTTYLLRIYTNTTYDVAGTFNIRVNAVYTLTSGTHNTTVITACDGYNPPALTITAPTNGFSTYNYQWNLNGTPIGGATTNSYDPSNLTPGTYSYTCTTTDACGLTATSTAKVITVVSDPGVTNPSNLTECLNDANSISVTGSGGTPSLNYQWYSNTTNSNTTGTLIPGAALSTYTPSSANTGTTYYYCVVSSTGSSCNNATSNTSTVTINGPSVTNINTASGSTLASGDYVWDGSSNTSWTVVNNWSIYNGTSFSIPTTDPTPTSNVFIVSSSTSQCVSAINSPVLNSSDNINDLTVVSGSTLDLSSNIISLTGNLKVDGSIIGTGTVRMNGTGNQNISGTGTIDLPNLQITKSSGIVTMSNPVRVTNTLTMNGGDISNGTNVLEVGTSATSVGTVNWNTGTITGPMKRWFLASTNSTIASGIFPVGNTLFNRYAQINFTTAPLSGGSITTRYVSGIPSTGYNGLPLFASDMQIVENYEDEGYWEITPDSYTGSLSQAQYTITLRGNNLTTVTDITIPRIIKSPGASHTTWYACGTHGIATGVPSDFIINSTAVTGFSFFNIGSSSIMPLPITLISFSGSCDENDVVLNWETASEYNTSHFNIEKSRDGFDWIKIQTIESAGNSNQLISYEYHDKSIDGIFYYRLVQYDMDGVYETYGPISINCLQSDTYFTTYPNPSDNTFSITLENENLVGYCELKFLDEMGKTVYLLDIQVKPGMNLIKMDKLDLQPGVYFLSIERGEFTTGVIKQVIK